MSIQVFDKADWQIDNGIDEENVIEHFKFIYQWLTDFNLLSEEGKEVFEIGIDSSISLNDKMVNGKGKKFLEKYYDKYLESINYGIKEDYILLKRMYQEMNVN